MSRGKLCKGLKLSPASEQCCLLQELVREAMLTRGIQRRKMKRLAERNATEMGAARLTGAFPITTVLDQAIMPDWSDQNLYMS